MGLVLLLATTACSVVTGGQPGTSAWKTQADQALGAAESSLGTAQLLLDAELRKRVTTAYAVVGVQDALTALDKKAQKFLQARPAAGKGEPDRRAATALLAAEAVLHTALDAASGSVAAQRQQALDQVRRTREQVSTLRTQVAR